MKFDLSNLTSKAFRPKRRVGRGYGSTNGGHSVGRGEKGQKARSIVRPFFEGTKSNKDFFRKTPMLRGKSKLKSYNRDAIVIKLSQLANFKEGSTVNIKSLVKEGIIDERQSMMFPVKVVFDKDIDKKLKIEVPASKTVVQKVA